jgi:hypothetical protein
VTARTKCAYRPCARLVSAGSRYCSSPCQFGGELAHRQDIEGRQLHRMDRVHLLTKRRGSIEEFDDGYGGPACALVRVDEGGLEWHHCDLLSLVVPGTGDLDEPARQVA